MQTLRAAAALLAAAKSLDSLTPIAAMLGAVDPAPLDDDAQLKLGIEHLVADVRVAAGQGASRTLLAELAPTTSARDALPRLAARLTTNAPHVLWTVICLHPQARQLAIAAWSDARRPPRVAALVVDQTRIVDSDAETLRALSTTASLHDLLAHTRRVEILGRESLTNRFYRALERAVEGIAESARVGTSETRREIALLDTSRLLFLSFLEAKGWLDGDHGFLTTQFEQCMSRGGGFHDRVLRPLFFGTLNTPVPKRAVTARRFGNISFLNGGLFARTPQERGARGLTFSDDAYGALIYDLFGQYRFTAREESATWTEAAVDPEMLGRAFESLMASRERRRTGAFFTPFLLVQRTANAALEAAFDDGIDAERLRATTVLDPACGSGAFLVHMLERLAELRAQHGDARDASAIRRDVLTQSIFGVDVNPTAVWLCQLRLWLSVVIESDETDPMRVVPLPNLDRNIRVGDALAGAAFGDIDRTRAATATRRLRERYARASGPKKDALARQLDRYERTRAIQIVDHEIARIAERRRDLVVAQRGRDLFGDRYRPTREERVATSQLRAQAASVRAARRRLVAGGALPFSFASHFGDVAARGGFSIVIGNPPWVRVHRLAKDQRALFRRTFVVARTAAWDTGAMAAGAGKGFSAQIDMAALFIERSLSLLAEPGTMALLVPAKLWRSLAGGGVRRFVSTESTLRVIEDYSDAAALFDAAVYPSLVVSRRRSTSTGVRVAVHHRGCSPFEWTAPSDTLSFDDTPGAPWLFLPPDARRAFDLLRGRGRPLAQSPIGRPLLGVKCGLNDAFIGRFENRNDTLTTLIDANDERFLIEADLVRPLVRGETLRAWSAGREGDAIVWTHDAGGAPLRHLPPNALRWLRRWRSQLRDRTDARHTERWWSLFRVEAARTDKPRVVWADVARTPRASVLDAGDARVPLNTCYVARCADRTDAHAFAALLNGPLSRAWLNAIAEPARGGYRRYLGWTLALLPVPNDWQRARRILAPIGERAAAGRTPSDVALLDAALAAYEITHDDVAPLVAWMAE